MARFVRVVLVTALVAASFSLVAGAPASATTSANVAKAVTWLKTQQQSDGGFEVAGFPGFETPDAIFALAEAAQTSGTWSTVEARAAVLGTSTAAGKTPLDNIDALATGAIGAGQVGKIIALVTNPLGLDPTTFDPSGNGAVNLVTKLGTPGPDNKWGLGLAGFNNILYAIRGYARVAAVPAATIQVVRDAQKSDGSWGFDGANTGTDGGPDTTGNAVQALIAAGVSPSDPDVVSALAYLNGQQQPEGGWTDGFSENPNTAAVAMLGLADAGDTGSLAAGDAYLTGLQGSDGRITSPYDSDPPNTSATSQGIEALVRHSVPTAATVVSPVSVPSATGNGALSVSTSTGTLADVTAVNPTTIASAPAGVTFPVGLVSFKVTGLDDGATATVSLVLPTGTTAAAYYKFDATKWSNATSLATFSGNTVTLALKDGGPGDEDGVANGVIVDPGGPSTVATSVAGVASAVGVDPRFTG